MNIFTKAYDSMWNFVRGTGGETFYFKAGQGNAEWDDMADKIKVAYRNPILLPGIQ